jgi:hypothetical protein
VERGTAVFLLSRLVNGREAFINKNGLGVNIRFADIILADNAEYANALDYRLPLSLSRSGTDCHFLIITQKEWCS